MADGLKSATLRVRGLGIGKDALDVGSERELFGVAQRTRGGLRKKRLESLDDGNGLSARRGRLAQQIDEIAHFGVSHNMQIKDFLEECVSELDAAMGEQIRAMVGRTEREKIAVRSSFAKLRTVLRSASSGERMAEYRVDDMRSEWARLLEQEVLTLANVRDFVQEVQR